MLVDFYFAQKTFFPKDVLPNSGCGLSTDAAYTRVNTVILVFLSLHLQIFSLNHQVLPKWSHLMTQKQRRKLKGKKKTMKKKKKKVG